MQNRECLYEIDKTGKLAEGIRRFPSIYIEGNAATGKSIAVRMLLKKHPEITSSVYHMEWELKEPQNFIGKLQAEKKKLSEDNHWLILDNLPGDLDEELCSILAEMVQRIENYSRILFVSREKPQIGFLRLLWEGNMELITTEQLLFSIEEVRCYVEAAESSWNAKLLYEKTGGWPGCISMLVRLEKNQACMEKTKKLSLFESYEMKHYVEQEILNSLEKEEASLLSYMAACPWVNATFCADVWGIERAPELLHNLYRKGMLLYVPEKKCWVINGLFRTMIHAMPLTPGKEDAWFEARGFIREAFQCLEKTGDKNAYHACMLRNYESVPALGLITEKVLRWTGKGVRDCYFRGVYYYRERDFEGLQRELAVLEKNKEKDHQVKELILNLSYLNPGLTLEDWLALLEEYSKDGRQFRMYHILGCGATCLCGIRDLAGLFVGAKKEVRQKEKLWKQSFGDYEWKCYQLARIDFYLETEQKEYIEEEDWAFLRDNNQKEPWQLRLAKLYLLCKLQREWPEVGRGERIYELEKSLQTESYEVCAKNAQAISSLYAPWYGHKEKLTKWLRDNVFDGVQTLTDENYLQCYCAAKGYLLLNQYDRAEKLIKKLIPYLQPYHRNRLMTELLFQYGIVSWKKELKGQATRCAIESFLVGGNSRYVAFYASYGQRGCPLIESYIEWQHANKPEGWTRKKKYNYGNVLRMPVEDYVQVVLRATKKVSRTELQFSEDYIEEHLTMMETMVLQNIAKGMSNAQICDTLGLKLPTVKGHAYSLYRKLGVENRTQAVGRGRELGLIE